MNCGDIVLVNYPYTDFSSTKVRPALIVGPVGFFDDEDVVIVGISSRIRDDDPYTFKILDSSPHFRETGLKVSSSVKWSKPMTVSVNIIPRKLGFLHRSLLQEIQVKIQSIFSC